MPLDKEARQPLYRQLMEELKEQIHAGKYKLEIRSQRNRSWLQYMR